MNGLLFLCFLLLVCVNAAVCWWPRSSGPGGTPASPSTHPDQTPGGAR